MSKKRNHRQNGKVLQVGKNQYYIGVRILNSKKILSLVVVLCVALFFVNSQALKEQNREALSSVHFGVMQGPSGLSSAMMDEDVQLTVFGSPDECTAHLINGELDFAILPANTALNLYNKGIKIKAVAVTCLGMLSLTGTNKNADKLSVPGLGGTPEYMAKLLYSEYEADYSSMSPAQLSQLLIAGKVELAVLPQPFVTMVVNSNPKIKIFEDVSQRWEKFTGQSQYPMSLLVVSDKFLDSEPDKVIEVCKCFERSVEIVNSNTEEVARKIEELGLMKAEIAQKAIPFCALVYTDGQETEELCNTYFSVLADLDSQAIGGKMPDRFFYLTWK